MLSPYRWLALGLLAVALYIGGVSTGWYGRGVMAAKDMAEVIAQHLDAMAEMERAARIQEAAYRAEESRRAAAHQEITDASILQAQRQVADARRAAATADSLRRAAQALARSGGAATDDPAATSGCAPATAASIVLADVLGSVEARGREMAEIADERGAGWAACQRAYDALTP